MKFGILIILIMNFVASSSFGQLSTNNLTKYTELEGLPSMQVNRVLADRFSLSYDIIKAHGGEINVKTSENVASEFNHTTVVTTGGKSFINRW